MLKRILEKIPSGKISLKSWILGFFCIVFVRIFVENFLSLSLGGYTTSDAPTIVHYFLFNLGVAVSFLLLLGLFMKDYGNLEKLMLFGFSFVWLPPVLDSIVSGGRGIFMRYPAASTPAALLHVLYGFFGTAPIGGVTPGQRIVVSVGVLLVFALVFLATKSLLKGVASSVLSFIVIFLWGGAPSIVKIAHDFFTARPPFFSTVQQFFYDSARVSVLAQNFLHPTIQLSYLRTVEIFFDATISHVYYILLTFLIAAYMFLAHRAATRAVLKNSRPLRVVFVVLLLAVGSAIAIHGTHPQIVSNWLDITSLVILFLSYYCAWMFAVGVNDLADVEIDKISNSSRPLASGALTEDNLRGANFLFLVWSLIGAFLVGNQILFLLVATLVASYIYSAPPLRLKRFPAVSNFLMALSYLAVVASGFFVLSSDKATRAFPMTWLLLIVVGVALGASVKDIKDIDGDRRSGIWTIPVLFGERIGKRVVGVMILIALMLVPAALGSWTLIISSFIVGAAAFALINRASYREWQLLVLLALYLLVLLFLLVL